MRKAYLLTTYKYPQKLDQATNVLNDVGFELEIIKAIDKETLGNNPVLSNSLSFIETLKLGISNNQDWFYFFEDDISLVAPIKLDEILEYENISDKVLYLGCSLGSGRHVYGVAPEGILTDKTIRGNIVYQLQGDIRCTHALGFSKQGAAFLLDCIYNNISKCHEKNPSDLNLSQLIQTKKIQPYCVRFDLKNPQNHTHLGVFYQDRSKVRTELN